MHYTTLAVCGLELTRFSILHACNALFVRAIEIGRTENTKLCSYLWEGIYDNHKNWKEQEKNTIEDNQNQKGESIIHCILKNRNAGERKCFLLFTFQSMSKLQINASTRLVYGERNFHMEVLILKHRDFGWH